MKKIFTLTAISIITVFVLVSCTKRAYFEEDEQYWYSQERGEVVYSSSICDFYVVQTFNGYEIIHSRDGYRPFEGTILYGNFSSYGSRNFYSPADRMLVYGEVMDYWLSYGAAQDEINYYCY